MKKLKKNDLKKVFGGCLFRGKGDTYVVIGISGKGEKIAEEFKRQEYRKALRYEWDHFKEKYPSLKNRNELNRWYNNGNFKGQYEDFNDEIAGYLII